MVKIHLMKKMVQSFDFIEKERGEISPSFFEYGTLAALRAFQTEAVDVVLLEVTGGSDATNIVGSRCVITSLAADSCWLAWRWHQCDWFWEGGIYRSGKPAICGQPKPPATVVAHADDIAEFYQVGIQYTYAKAGWRYWNLA